MKTIDLFRHTDNESDSLSADGVAAAVAIGNTLRGDYELAVSTGAQRATQTIGCILAGMAQRVERGVLVVTALRSEVEDQWRAAFKAAGAGDIVSLQKADPDLVAADSKSLAEGLREVFAMLSDNGRALAVGHSPTNEAAIFGLTGVVVEPMAKGQSISVSQVGETFLIDDR